MTTHEQAEAILGRELTDQEEIIINVFGNDDRYVFSTDENGNLLATIKNKGT